MPKPAEPDDLVAKIAVLARSGRPKSGERAQSRLMADALVPKRASAPASRVDHLSDADALASLNSAPRQAQPIWADKA